MQRGLTVRDTNLEDLSDELQVFAERLARVEGVFQCYLLPVHIAESEPEPRLITQPLVVVPRRAHHPSLCIPHQSAVADDIETRGLA